MSTENHDVTGFEALANELEQTHLLSLKDIDAITGADESTDDLRKLARKELDALLVEQRHREGRQLARERLIKDIKALSDADPMQVIGILRKSTVVQYSGGREVRKLSPFKLYARLWNDRYEGLIKSDSDQLREQQFANAVCAALRAFIDDSFGTASANERKAVQRALEQIEGIGFQSATLTRVVGPVDYGLKSYFQKKYGSRIFG